MKAVAINTCINFKVKYQRKYQEFTVNYDAFNNCRFFKDVTIFK